jgi:hypothetical protein
VVAAAALSALRQELVGSDPAAVQRFFYGVSGVVRAYVEARYGLNATDLTTGEIRERLERVAGLSAGLGVELVALLDVADAVKFARSPASLADCDEALGRARGFLEATRHVAVSAASAGEPPSRGGPA